MNKKDEKDFLKNLKINQRLDGIMFAVGRIESKIAKNGNPFISLRLGDKTGYCNAQIWVKDEKEQRDLIEQIKPGNVIKVKGFFDQYKGEGSIKIETQKGNYVQLVPEGEYDISDFREVTQKDIVKMIDEIKGIIDKMKNHSLKALCTYFINDTNFLDKFKKSPGAESKHHNYVGGLVTHTYEVMKICELVMNFYPKLDGDLLLTGALLHDCGKIESYAYKEAAVVLTDKNNLVGHIVLGSMIVKEAINKLRSTGLEFSPDLEDQVLHLILSHHGQIELGYGSAVNPKTVESIVLFHADNLDSQTESAIRSFSVKNID